MAYIDNSEAFFVRPKRKSTLKHSPNIHDNSFIIRTFHYQNADTLMATSLPDSLVVTQKFPLGNKFIYAEQRKPDNIMP